MTKENCAGRWLLTSGDRSGFPWVLALYQRRQFSKRFAENWRAVLLFNPSPGRAPKETTARGVIEKPSHGLGKCLGLVGNQNLRAVDEFESFRSKCG